MENENIEYIPGTNIPKPRLRGINEDDASYIAYLKEYYNKYFPETEKEASNTVVESKIEEPEKNVDKITLEEVNEEILKDDEEDFEMKIPTEQIPEQESEKISEIEADKPFEFDLSPLEEEKNIEIEEEQKLIKPDFDEEYVKNILKEEENNLRNNVQEVMKDETSNVTEFEFNLDPKEEVVVETAPIKEESTQEENLSEAKPIVEEVKEETDNQEFKFDLSEPVEVVSYTDSNSNLMSKVRNVNFLSKVKNFFNNVKENVTNFINNITGNTEFSFSLEEPAIENGYSR